MQLPIYQVDAFTESVFGGNPAAVVPLEQWLPDELMQRIAAENNQSETAFLVGGNGRYQLRWFTPTFEIDLCGHATLAAAYVLFEHKGEKSNSIMFETQSGELIVTRQGDLLGMDFPARPAVHCDAPALLFDAIGKEPLTIYKAREYMCVYPHEEDILALTPNSALFQKVDCFGVVVTAPSNDSACDFVSRYFYYEDGVKEDPVTGSAHCTLIPYWAEQLDKQMLFAKQVSHRGGELVCELKGNRVRISGKAVLYMQGQITTDQE